MKQIYVFNGNLQNQMDLKGRFNQISEESY